MSRLSLTPAEVAAILDYRLSVPLGERSGCIHKLFFSIPDDQCFVAVQDEVVGAVVTVLPLEYHSAWPVSQDARSQARALMLEGPSSWRSAPSAGSATVFRVGCYFADPEGGVRTANLGSMPLARIGGKIAGVLESEEVLAEIETKAAMARRPDEELTRVFVYLGKLKDVIIVHFGI